MIDLSNTEFHKVFLVESKGDVLIVSPTGEAFEFRPNLVVTELNSILELASEEEVKHLVVDLSREAYFGSVIIGAVNSMITKFRKQGGQAVTCSASAEMQKVIEVMNLTDTWPNHASRRKAIKAVKSA